MYTLVDILLFFFQKDVSTCKLCRRPDDIVNIKKKVKK